MTANENLSFRLKPGGYRERFDRSHVKFEHESAGEKLNLTGQFLVRTIGGFEFVELHCQHKLYPSDPPNTYWVFKLRQPYVDAIVPIDDPNSNVRFELKLPLQEVQILKAVNPESQTCGISSDR